MIYRVDYNIDLAQSFSLAKQKIDFRFIPRNMIMPIMISNQEKRKKLGINNSQDLSVE